MRIQPNKDHWHLHYDDSSSKTLRVMGVRMSPNFSGILDIGYSSLFSGVHKAPNKDYKRVQYQEYSSRIFRVMGSRQK